MTSEIKLDYSMYIKVFALLIGLTILTIAQPLLFHSDSLAMTLSVQLAIAFVKAFLIVAYYMHLKMEHKIFTGFFFFMLLIFVVIYLIMAIDLFYREFGNDAYTILN